MEREGAQDRWSKIYEAEADEFGRMYIKTDKWCQLLSVGFYTIVGLHSVKV